MAAKLEQTARKKQSLLKMVIFKIVLFYSFTTNVHNFHFIQEVDSEKLWIVSTDKFYEEL